MNTVVRNRIEAAAEAETEKAVLESIVNEKLADRSYEAEQLTTLASEELENQHQRSLDAEAAVAPVAPQAAAPSARSREGGGARP